MINIDQIIAFESGELPPSGILDLFSELVSNGTAWNLQGFYGRTALDLIENGLLTPEGEITDLARDFLADYEAAVEE